MAEKPKNEEVKHSETWVAFPKPYVFEGTTYDGIDLAPLCEGADSSVLSRVESYCRSNNIDLPFPPEQSWDYLCAVLSFSLGKPLEFFHRMPYRDAALLRTATQKRFFIDLASLG